jgi:hypothetical protein
MPERRDRHTSAPDGAATPLHRWGILAAVAALVAGGLTRMTASSVQAGTDGDLVLNTANTTTSRTTIQAAAINYPSGAVLTTDARADTGSGTRGSEALASGGFEAITALGGPSGGDGIVAFGGGPNGAQGRGVWGVNNSTPNAAVSGQNSGAGPGVRGLSTTGIEVQSSAGSVSGVYGNSSAGVGVWGDSDVNSGVVGRANSGAGVFGQSTSNAGGSGPLHQQLRGVWALREQRGRVRHFHRRLRRVRADEQHPGGVRRGRQRHGGPGESSTGFGVYGHSVSGQAGHFDGVVVVNGAFTVVGGPKSAAVPFPDGTVRRMYVTEAPESRFEDYGEAQLVNGRARVPIPADFAQAVNTSAPHHVFLTPHTAEIESLAVPVRAPDISRSRRTARAR